MNTDTLEDAKNKYRAIMIDPPWTYKVWAASNGDTRLAGNHYPLLTNEELKKLNMQCLMAEDCAVFVWVTWPLLVEAIDIIQCWGLTYKTLAFNWVKLGAKGKVLFNMGHWTRANSEPCLLFTKGSPKRKSQSVAQTIVDDGQLFLFEDNNTILAQTLAHSAKPREAYERVEQLVAGPYLDIFARRKRKGWDAIGNEIDGRDIRDVLNAIEANGQLPLF